MTGLVVCLLVFPLIGAAVSRRNPGEPYLLGLGVCGAVLYAAGALGISMRWTFVALVGAAIVQLARERAHARWSAPARGTRVATLLTCVPLLVVAYDATVAPLGDFDGRVFWVLKAKGIAHDGSIRGPFFRGEEVFTPRNHYPLLIPIDDAVVMTLARSLDDRHVRWLYALTFAALVLHLRERLRRWVSPAAAAWCAAIVAWLPQFAMQNDGGAISAYNDVPLAAFAAGAFFELLEARSPMRFAGWLAFLPLTKNEGLPLALILLALGIYAFRRRVTPAVASVVLAVATLFLARRGIPATGDENLFTEWPLVLERLHRIGPVLAAMARHAFAPAAWGFFWIAAIAAAVYLAMKRDTIVVLPSIVIASMLAVYFAVYLCTSWVAVDLVNASFDRLLMHLVAPAVFVIAAVTRHARG